MEKQAIERMMSRVRFNCDFCGVEMKRAWSGYTPFGNFLTADICPICFATRYVCPQKDDPVFKLLSEINCAFTQVWKEKIRGSEHD